MLPDYPNVKKTVDSLFRKHVHEKVFGRSPIFSEIRRVRQHEGSGGTYEEVDGKEHQIEYEKVAAALSLTPDEMRSGSFQDIVSKFEEVAETFNEAFSQMMFATISKAAESGGNVVDAKGKLTKETFLELRRTMPLEFDPSTGEAQYPTMVLHPETWDKINPDPALAHSRTAGGAIMTRGCGDLARAVAFSGPNRASAGDRRGSGGTPGGSRRHGDGAPPRGAFARPGPGSVRRARAAGGRPRWCGAPAGGGRGPARRARTRARFGGRGR